MTSDRTSLRAYGTLALTMVFWAGNTIVGRAVRGEIGPFTLAFGRWFIALLILTPFVLRGPSAQWPQVRRHWKAILFLGLVGVAAFNGFLYAGLRHTTASNGLLLQALIPGLVLLTGVLVFRDRVSLGQVVGVLLSTLGVAIIVFQGDPHAVLQLRLGSGDALILCGCVAWAIYTACLRLRPPISPLTFMYATFCIAAAAMAPFALNEWQTETIAWSPGVIGALAYVGIFPSLCAYFLYNDAVARLGSGAAGQTISLMPVFGALLATQLLGERLYTYHGVGMAAILTGIVLTWLMLRARQAPSAPRVPPID
jgi:drug/metabolite transporter (DMT)-like permease